MAATILLSIFAVLCVIFLLPLRVKASFGDGKWSVCVYYACFRVFRKESAPPPPPPKYPPKPNDPPENAPAAVPVTDTADVAAPQAEEAPAPKPEQPPDAQDQPQEAEPEPVTEEKPESAAEDADAAEKTQDTEDAESTNEAAAPPKKKWLLKRYIGWLKPHSVASVTALIRDGSASLSPALRFLTKHFHFRHLRLYLAVGTDDAAKTAQLYGAVSAAVYNLLGALQCWCDIVTDECRILADFFREKITFRAALELRCSPAALLLTVLILGIRFLWRTFTRFCREEKDAKRREQESQPLPLEV